MIRPVAVHVPVAPVLPLVLDSPHSGEDYPPQFDHVLPLGILRQAEDTHVGRLWSAAPRYGATLVEALFPRAFIDPNRNLDDLDVALLTEAWDGPLNPSRKSEQGIGLVWRLAESGAPLYARMLSCDEVRARIRDYWQPYHVALEAALNERHRRFGAVWHLNCHSMPAVGGARSDDPGRERVDFVLGDRDGTTCAADFTAFVGATLASLGYSVAVNDPYKGVELVRRHGRPHERRHSLQVEIKRTLYMDERTLLPNDGYARLQRDLERLLAALAAFVQDASATRSLSAG